MKPAGDVTQLLIRWSRGDHSAADELMDVIYDELRGLARGHLRHKRPDQSLQATSLVHEAYLRMVDQDLIFENRLNLASLQS